MHCTVWFPTNGSNPVPLNPDGMPASGSASCLMDTLGYPSGLYQFYGKGKFTIDFRGCAYANWPNNGTVPGTQKTVDGVTTALVQVTTAAPGLGTYNGSPNPGLICDITVNDPNDPPRDFHFISPGYKAWPNTNATFTTEYLQAVRPFTCFRVMQWMGGNSPVTTWASRAQPNVFGNRNAGAAYERIIELANTTNRDIWINIPPKATDDWAAGMAQLLKTTLKPGLHVYIEYSNEVWNWGGPAYYPDWLLIETWDQSNEALTTHGAWARHGQEVAFLLMHYIQIMQPIMGSQARFVLAGQYGNTIYSSAGLAWIQQVYGPPSKYIYAIAGAPYFGGAGTDLDSIFASISTNLNLIAQELKLEVALAKQYNVKYCCYESGQSMAATQSSFSLGQAAQQDPRMGLAYQAYANVMNQAGIDLCCFFSFVNDWDSYGFYAAAPDIRETIQNPTVKYAAEAAIANSGRQNIAVAGLTTGNTKLTKALALAAAKAAAAKASAAAAAAKIKTAEARAAAEAAKVRLKEEEEAAAKAKEHKH